MKQHHVHLLIVDANVREPLAAWKRKGNPNLCKADFPRMKWLVTKAVILCAKRLQHMDQNTSGRRCMLGPMHGPMNHPCINGTHPAMFACQRCNSDVQLPYRFPRILKVIAVMMKHAYATTIKLWYTLHREHKMHKQDMLVTVVRKDNRAFLRKSRNVVKVIPIRHSV